jgi:hypothetical protein
MIYIYGDSHARFSFMNLGIPFYDKCEYSITMHRIGRDNQIVNFNNWEHDHNSVICIVYGEIDCRCHIQRQIDLGKNEDDVIHELVENYFKTIKNNVTICKKIVIVGIIPPTKQEDCETFNGSIQESHPYPFAGTDLDRVRYTTKMNNLIQEFCTTHDFVYFNPYQYYTREDGTFDYEYSDKTMHLKDNAYFLEKFVELYSAL